MSCTYQQLERFACEVNELLGGERMCLDAMLGKLVDMKGEADAKDASERTCHLRDYGGQSGRSDLLVCDECGGVTYDMYPHPNYCPYCGAKVMRDDG